MLNAAGWGFGVTVLGEDKQISLLLLPISSDGEEEAGVCLPPLPLSPACISSTSCFVANLTAQRQGDASTEALPTSRGKRKSSELSARVWAQPQGSVQSGPSCGTTDLVFLLTFVSTCLGGISFCLDYTSIQENLFTVFFLAVFICSAVIHFSLWPFVQAFLVLLVLCL